jgi:Spy/CpxP family protein refolding chaperone
MRTFSLRLALVAATFATTGLLAQAAPPTAPRQTAPTQTGRGNMMANMAKELNLTPEQQTKVEALMKDMMAQRGNMQSPPSDADRQAMQASRATMEAKMKEILTPEQYAKLQTMRPQRGQRGGGQSSN